MLTGSDLVMAVFHVNPHGFQGQDGVPPKFGGDVQRGQIEIAPLVEALGFSLGRS